MNNSAIAELSIISRGTTGRIVRAEEMIETVERYFGQLTPEKIFQLVG